MATRLVLGIGAFVGFCISLAVLVLLWFGVAGVLNVGRTDLMYIFWPSSLMLTVGWRSTAPGIATTVVSVALNCMLYMAVAYGLYRIVLGGDKSVRS
jgi:hypothetical protein